VDAPNVFAVRSREHAVAVPGCAIAVAGARMRLAVVVFVSGLSCKSGSIDPLDTPGDGTPAPSAQESLTISGHAAEVVDVGGGRTAYISEAIFLGSSLSAASGPVSLHVQGITAAPGSEAEIYWTTMPEPEFGPANYIGTITTVEGSPTLIPEIVLDVHDDDVDGKKYLARTTLRDMPFYSVTMVVTRGSVTVDQYTLTAPRDPH
jgi:hypothetical protein